MRKKITNWDYAEEQPATHEGSVGHAVITPDGTYHKQEVMSYGPWSSLRPFMPDEDDATEAAFDNVDLDKVSAGPTTFGDESTNVPSDATEGCAYTGFDGSQLIVWGTGNDWELRGFMPDGVERVSGGIRYLDPAQPGIQFQINYKGKVRHRTGTLKEEWVEV